MNTDITEDQRIGKEIIKQQAELYRRIRNTLRWLLGCLDGYSDAEAVHYGEMPELERYMLHRLAELGQRVQSAVKTYDWAGVFPDLHGFCATDLSAFYFDIRKDSLYCDSADSLRRRACRTVLDQLHRCLCTWLAPVLVFTAEEAWCARFGEESSVHLQLFPELPPLWLDPMLAERWTALREARAGITAAVEVERREKRIGSSLEATVTLGSESPALVLADATAWAELAIVSQVDVGGIGVSAKPAEGSKCVRCWRVLPEVGQSHEHPELCLRCEGVVAR